MGGGVRGSGRGGVPAPRRSVTVAFAGAPAEPGVGRDSDGTCLGGPCCQDTPPSTPGQPVPITRPLWPWLPRGGWGAQRQSASGRAGWRLPAAPPVGLTARQPATDREWLRRVRGGGGGVATWTPARRQLLRSQGAPLAYPQPAARLVEAGRPMWPRRPPHVVMGWWPTTHGRRGRRGRSTVGEGEERQGPGRSLQATSDATKVPPAEPREASTTSAFSSGGPRGGPTCGSCSPRAGRGPLPTTKSGGTSHIPLPPWLLLRDGG